MRSSFKFALIPFLSCFACIDEQYQQSSQEEVEKLEEIKAEPVDEDVQKLNEDLGEREEATNPEYTIAEVLFESVQKGDLEKVKAIFTGGLVVDANLRNPTDTQDNKTLLMEAAAWGRIAIVEYLLSVGADASLTDNGDKIAFDWAKTINNVLIMELLSGKTLSPDLMLEKLYEFCAVGGQAEAIVFILSRDVNPDYARENDNISPLFEAARNGKIDSIKALLDNGASVNFHRKGHTGLIGAITSKNPEVVDVMLQYRADPKIPFERGARKATPRQYADATLKSQPDILAAVTALLDAALLKSE